MADFPDYHDYKGATGISDHNPSKMYITRIILIFISLLVISSTGCEKTKFSVYNIYSGQATATVNGGDQWQARTFISKSTVGNEDSDTYTVHLDVHNSNDFLRESLIAILVNPYPDTIVPFDRGIVSPGDTLLPNVHYGTSQDDGDVQCALYTIDSTFDNYFIVDKFNANTYEVSGRFSMRYINKDFTLCTLPFTDTITFNNGQFTTAELYRGD